MLPHAALLSALLVVASAASPLEVAELAAADGGPPTPLDELATAAVISDTMAAYTAFARGAAQLLARGVDATMIAQLAEQAAREEGAKAAVDKVTEAEHERLAAEEARVRAEVAAHIEEAARQKAREPNLIESFKLIFMIVILVGGFLGLLESPHKMDK